MKRTKRTIIAALLVLTGIALATNTLIRPAYAQSLPACSATGDKDGDLVLDALDSDETDSCLASSSGLEDCLTGAGDGLPDCQ